VSYDVTKLVFNCRQAFRDVYNDFLGEIESDLSLTSDRWFDIEIGLYDSLLVKPISGPVASSFDLMLEGGFFEPLKFKLNPSAQLTALKVVKVGQNKRKYVPLSEDVGTLGGVFQGFDTRPENCSIVEFKFFSGEVRSSSNGQVEPGTDIIVDMDPVDTTFFVEQEPHCSMKE
jgi:hypothetical protein